VTASLARRISAKEVRIIVAPSAIKASRL